MSCLWVNILPLFNRKETINVGNRLFRIKKRLGDGQFGCVYLVQQKDTGKLYALKRVICHNAEDEDRVENEIKVHRIASRSPYLLPCEDFAIAPTSICEQLTSDKAVPRDYSISANNASPVEYNILLPYFKRGTLQEELRWRLAAGDYINENRVWKLFHNICHGLNVLHSLPEPFVHGDLKVANVLLSDDDDRAVLMDFGSARPAVFEVKNEKLARQIQEYSAEHCSLYYRAPELFDAKVGDILDQRTDIWSLGCLLYALCFWVSPFEEAANRGDSLRLLFLSLKYRIPSKSPYSKALHDMIALMLEVDFTRRPFLSEIIQRLENMDFISNDL